MSGRRVVITGIGLCSPIGNSLDQVSTALQELRHGIVRMEGWDKIGQLETRLAAPVPGIERSEFPRKKIRTMGRVALLAAWASDRAIAEAGLSEADLQSGHVGLAYGSTHGSTSEMESYARTVFANNSLAGLESSGYLTFMSHTCAANLAMYYGIQGRIITTCSACVSASQAIGYGFEAIRAGQQEVMVCGGAEEMHFTHAGIFDIMYATSTKFNDHPELSPRPFDTRRDGLVVGEGAATLVLESYERAAARGAHIHAEILGFGTNCDGQHITRPSWEGMAGAMRLAMADARLQPGDIDYINAHGTATELGDIAESLATASILGTGIPVSSTKSYTAHTLGACGGIESIICLAAMRDSLVPPTRNLVEVDERCAPLDFVRDACRPKTLRRVMNNNFAFGGINTSLILGAV